MDKYCKMTKLYKEPKGEYNIYTVVFFLTQNAYKNKEAYFDGLKYNLQKFYHQFDNSFYFRLYYDKSITEKIHSNNELNDFTEIIKKYLDEIKNSPRVQLIEYECPNFKINNYHRGMFGTILRFSSLFSAEKIKTIAMSDIEKFAIFDVKLVYEYMINNNADLAWRTNGILPVKDLRIIHNDWIYAGNFISNIKFDKKILNLFFEHIKNKNKKFMKYLNLNKSYLDLDKNKKFDNLVNTENIYIYGIDEIFLNFYLKPHMENKKVLLLPITRALYLLSNHYKHNNKYNNITDAQKNSINEFFSLLFPSMTNKSHSPKKNFFNINKKTFNSDIKIYINFENNLTQNYQKIIDNKQKYLFSDKTERLINQGYKKARIKKIINYKYKYEKWIN
jgi:hypothetical protein